MIALLVPCKVNAGKRHAADPPNFVMNLPILAYMLIFNWYNRNRLPNNRPACTAWNSPIRPSGLKSSPKVQLICTSTFDLSLSKGPAKACSPKSESIVLLRAIVKPRRVHEGYSQNVTALGSVEILRATYVWEKHCSPFQFTEHSAGKLMIWVHADQRAFKLHWPVTISTSALSHAKQRIQPSSAGGDSMETDLTSLIPLMVIDSIDPLKQTASLHITDVRPMKSAFLPGKKILLQKTLQQWSLVPQLRSSSCNHVK
ncbi:hypothetical protein T4E_7998 [Trichinella pseudospiralis]|uniref:Uncharacterized protein n=1 Tax=Trichinella pseudospiralis TaxID=6337 RepID=A0A0V0YL54_TRIPS|nr:hypothetical protein T4E_7998 [Trichinella pseudospiralis]